MINAFCFLFHDTNYTINQVGDIRSRSKLVIKHTINLTFIQLFFHDRQ